MSKITYFIMMLAALTTSGVALASQNVGGMEIDYAPTFHPNVAKAQSMVSQIPDEARPLIFSIEIFEAPPTAGIDSIQLIKTRYANGFQANIDGAILGGIANIVNLPGVTKPVKSILPLTISGFAARRASFDANRYRGVIGGDILVVYDNISGTLYQLQIFFAKKLGLNPFSSMSLDDEHALAATIINSAHFSE
jgi:hypothetical protein